MATLSALLRLIATRRSRLVLWTPLALLFFVLLVEIILRVAFGLGRPVLFAPNPEYGYFMLPNQHVHRFGVQIDTNSYGMRSPEFRMEKPAGTLRLMFVGDSITYGTTRVGQDQIFTDVIRREIPTQIHRPVEVLNASANAWAISNEYNFVRSHGTFGSDYVLLVLNSGDMSQRFSKLSEVAEAVSTEPTTAIGEAFSKVILPKLLQLKRKRDAGTAIGDDLAAEGQNLLDLTALDNFVRARNSCLVIVYIPFRKSVAYGVKGSAPPRLIAWAAQHKDTLLDLSSAVSPFSTETVTLNDRTHFNMRGNRLIASALEEQLRRVLNLIGQRRCLVHPR